MAGVTQATGDLLGATSLTPGAQLVAAWSNGQPFVATNHDNIVGVNIFVAQPGFWSGDVPLVLHNAVAWAAGSTWLTADRTSAQIAPGAQLTVTLTFDATGLNGGNYEAAVRLQSNDPDESLVEVPAHLHVTGAPDIAVTAPDVVVESTQPYTTSGASTQHTLPIAVPPA